MEEKQLFVMVDENGRIIGTEPIEGDLIDSNKYEVSKEKLTNQNLFYRRNVSSCLK
ncbi:hypothetical protein [Peribacillus butanolivorans]|uniref:hypothetical protein n=1 Tax=Peribacillus butanolivorans TaxID=421767 RepID=UPI0036536392